jgi:hypothetical protein
MLFAARVCLLALSVAVTAGAFAADLASRSAPPGGPISLDGGPGGHSAHVWRGSRFGGGGVTWGLAPGIGQLGAAGFGYFAVANCWREEPVFDRFGAYLHTEPIYICVPPPVD